jgi:hypothetical protein
MILILLVYGTSSLNFNFYMLLCGNNALKQKADHSSMAYYVHVLLYNAAKQMFAC